MIKTLNIFTSSLIVSLAFFSTAIAATNVKSSTNFSPTIYSDFSDEEDEDFDFYENDTSSAIYDPLEKINRKIYVFNDHFDRYFLEHVAMFYHDGVPDLARTSIHNFLTNLSLPMSALNSILQGKVDNGLATFSNFIINSTLGLAGLIDIASQKNLPFKMEDFGQTLGYYGMGSGAYLMVPFLGPSSTRDFTGIALDTALDPLKLNLLKFGHHKDFINDEIKLTITGMVAIDTRENLLDILQGIREESFDPYATIRSAYLQKRESDIKF